MPQDTTVSLFDRRLRLDVNFNPDDGTTELSVTDNRTNNESYIEPSLLTPRQVVENARHLVSQHIRDYEYARDVVEEVYYDQPNAVWAPINMKSNKRK